MITIYSKPYTQLPLNVNPVYNGLPFVVGSNFTSASNFRYIAEVYYNNQKVTELRHHPDISHDKKGVFDIGRIIENYMSYDINVLNIQGTNALATFPANNTVNGYHINFGEEMSRVLTFKSIGTGTGGTLFNANEPNAMFATLSGANNDYVYVQGSNIASYNGWKRLVYRSGSNNFVLDTPNVGQPDFSLMYAIQGQKIVKFGSVVVNGINRVKIWLKKQGEPNRLQVGDRVLFGSTIGGALNPFYTLSEWNVMVGPVEETITTYGVCWAITLDCPYKFTIASTAQGAIISKDNYVFKNLVSTAVDKSYAWTGVRQYENEYLDLSANKIDPQWPKLFQKGSSAPTATQYMKTFSDHPTKVVSICQNEIYQITSMGSWMNKIGTGDPKRETQIRLETWSIDTSTTSTGTIVSTTGVNSFQSLSYQMGSLGGTTFGVGDYVTLSNGSTSVQARIVAITYTAPYNYIHTNAPFNALLIGSGTLTSTIKVRYRDCQLQANAQNFPCGPANLRNYLEIPNGLCYKYFVYPIVPVASNYYFPSGGIPTFNSTSNQNGTNFPGNRPRVGEKWEFNIDQSCCTDMPTYKIMWLNKQGGFDFYKFTKRSDKKFTITKEGFRRKLPNIQSTNIYGYKSGQRGQTTYNTTSTESLTINSDFLTQEELDWLVNIYESPEVYIVEDKTTNAFIIPVTVIAEEVLHPNKTFRGDNGSLYQYQLVIEKANPRVIQRGGSSGGSVNSNSGDTGGVPGTGGGRPPYEPWINTTYTKSLYE